MNRLLQTVFFLFMGLTAAHATTIKGRVYDRKTGETLIGATVQLDKTGLVTSTGLDGSFELKHVPLGAQLLRVSYLRYKTVVMELNIQKEDNDKLKIYLEEQNGKDLNEVVIQAKHDGSAEKTARRLEQQSVPMVNMVSGKAMEISPDLTVANVIQRVSGVSIERNSNGDGQYAILRGMDKRYNYTLVNGVKIPSPDNKYRYVPLDIFPSELLERLEVYKTLTPNMEADAVGGVVNMVMKDAPERLQVNANFAAGYSQMFLDRNFMSYDASGINYKSPYEINGKNYNATQSDFPKGVRDYKWKSPAPNLIGGLSVGQRFLNHKLGVIVAGSYQNTYRGSNSTFYNSAVVDASNKYARVTGLSERQYSEQQKRYGLNAKVDYVFNQNHKISLYNVYLNLVNQQVRDVLSTDFSSDYDPVKGNAQLSYTTRSRLTEQQIYNSTLHGDHKLLDGRLKIQWSGVYSSAKNDVPDNTIIGLSGERVNFQDRRTVAKTNASSSRWERNTDEDKAAYLDVTYTADIAGTKVDFSAGGLYRDKQRSSFYNNYTLTPVNTAAKYGVDFNNYTQIDFKVQNPTGGVSNPLTNNASEQTSAVYGMFKFTVKDLQVVGGLRAEHTNQGYDLLFPAGEKFPKGSQVYTDYLPSLNLKYELNKHQNLRASYFRSLNRPGFYEIIPGKVVNEEYQERGNPDLKRALADNLDIRYELFPNAGDQLLVGAFYKKIKDPIEYIFKPDETRGQDTYYSPGNFGVARNYGLEIDYIKFIHKFGIKANYTYTHSSITTPKSKKIIDENQMPKNILVDQTRPLYGQSAHVANLSFLYKSTKKKWDAQIAASYTGPRINTVSQFLDNDLWQEGFIQLDASVEKGFKNGLSVFIKGGNLLNTPSRLFIKGINPADAGIARQEEGRTIIRDDQYKQTYLLGIRYKL
eukprot:gene14621-17294_t